MKDCPRIDVMTPRETDRFYRRKLFATSCHKQTKKTMPSERDRNIKHYYMDYTNNNSNNNIDDGDEKHSIIYQ